MINWAIFGDLLGLGGGSGAAPAIDAHWEWKVASLPPMHFAVDATPLHFVAAELQPIGFVAAAPQVHFKTHTPPMHFRAEDQE